MLFSATLWHVFSFSTQKKIYKDQMEFMLQNHVFPLFRSELGYMRARVSDHFPTGSPKICVFNITEWGGFELGPACFTGLVLCFCLYYIQYKMVSATFSQPLFSHRPAGCCITSARWSSKVTRTCRRLLSWLAFVSSMTTRCQSRWRLLLPCRFSSATRRKVSKWSHAPNVYLTALYFHIFFRNVIN